MISPLLPDVPIVDAQGRPTPQFIRQWEELRRVVTGHSGVHDTGTHTLLLQIEDGRIVNVEES